MLAFNSPGTKSLPAALGKRDRQSTDFYTPMDGMPCYKRNCGNEREQEEQWDEQVPYAGQVGVLGASSLSLSSLGEGDTDMSTTTGPLMGSALHANASGPLQGSGPDTQVTIWWCGAAQNLCLHCWWLPAPRKRLHRNLHAHARKLVCTCSPADSMRLFHGTVLVCMALTVNGERCLPGSG
jgi:hypothetical protein